MKYIKKLRDYLEIKWEIATYDLRNRLQVRKFKKLYPDYEDNEFNCGSLKHIWGITSWDDLTGKDACLYTMNDIDITYDREEEKYLLGIETAYLFKNRNSECEYLINLLGAFTKFMDDNEYSKENNFTIFFGNPRTSTSAKTIDELYTNFRIFVEGYCKVCGYDRT